MAFRSVSIWDYFTGGKFFFWFSLSASLLNTFSLRFLRKESESSTRFDTCCFLGAGSCCLQLLFRLTRIWFLGGLWQHFQQNLLHWKHTLSWHRSHSSIPMPLVHLLQNSPAWNWNPPCISSSSPASSVLICLIYLFCLVIFLTTSKIYSYCFPFVPSNSCNESCFICMSIYSISIFEFRALTQLWSYSIFLRKDS